jgi:hypothetical protein
MAAKPKPVIDVALVSQDLYLKAFLNRLILHLNCVLRAAGKREHNLVNANMSRG